MIVENVSARQIGRQRHCSVLTVYRQCREAICRLLSGPELSGLPNSEALVLIVDGLRFNIRGVRWVQYTMAFKPVDVSLAYFADSLLMPGGESATSWQYALESIEPERRARIRALVADGLRGMKEVAALNGWVYQRCHFHIRAQLRYWLGSSWVYPRDKAISWAIDDALLSTDEGRAETARAALDDHVRAYPGGMSCILRQLVREWAAIRAYLWYPHLNIPRTTGTVESMHSRLRTILSGVSTIRAIRHRATAFIRLHGPFACNGTHFQQH